MHGWQISDNSFRKGYQMLAGQIKMPIMKKVLPVLVLLAGIPLTGCQSYSSSYSKAENRIFRHFDKWSREVPKGMFPAAVEKDGDYTVYSYRTPGPGHLTGTSECTVSYMTSPKTKLLAIADDRPREKNKLGLVSFVVYEGRREFGSGTGRSLVFDRSLILRSETESIIYFREKGTAIWRSCQMPGQVELSWTPQQQEQCLQGAKEVPAEQIQRYVDMTRRFYEVYFLIK